MSRFEPARSKRLLSDCKNIPSLLFAAAPLMLALGWSFSAQRAFHIEGSAWMIWGIWWLAMAFFSKSTKRRENSLRRLGHIAVIVLGFALLFREGWQWPLLLRPVFPDKPVLMLLCVVVTLAGLLFSAWARLALGGNWSGSVAIKKDHQLIRRGPYRFIRHPIYTGMLTALLATAVTQRLTGGLLGFVIILFALYRKARSEESFLSQEFGDAFAEHRQHTGMFLPRLS